MAVADGAKRNVMGDDQPDRRLDLIHRRAKHCREHDGRRDRAMNDVVDLMFLERKHFGQSAADFVQENHRS